VSQEDASGFIDFVGQSPQLQDEIATFSGAGSMDRLVELGKQHGFQFSVDDYRQAVVELAEGELSDEALDEVLRESGLK